MMKQSILFLSAALLVGSASAQKTYRIQGSVPGAKDGLKVYLTDDFQQGKGGLHDSATIKNEQFELKGKAAWGFSRHVSLMVDKNPGVPRDRKMVRFFMGDEQVKVECCMDSLPGYYYNTGGRMENVIITGSKDQEIYQRFREQVKALRQKNSELYDAYLKEYHIPAADGTFNTARGIELSRELEKTRQELHRQRMEFMKAHKSSVVSAYLAVEILGSTNSRFTAAEIDAIAAIPAASLANSTIMKEVKKMAATAKITAKGKSYIDIPLMDKSGKTVQLSSLIKPGQYNMLEFWASWCGPCRAEIPHLRELSKTVSDKDFNIISISIDERKADWEKAMKEEHMEWTQACDPKGWDGPVAQRYKVQGVPFSIILDPAGKIVASEVRGAELDLVMKNLLGDKITAF
ncbi:thiol-disulfide isomerase/thioredoxin [Chitinophaga dinghuensis]|uniref:Thiol-disulfide isomerase/thioredoxin n=1 Tax=Chitinophaga dinghuensis TaxID=1539050 RepID=A0A327VXZ6_9BACT|nr:thioredoxin-like domain-containing protein [Chitinophaga dinghuensis]RAJ81867.1 thiol-disulfide isomerase/thioredoxin [Chitinophaga dinghuensis]